MIINLTLIIGTIGMLFLLIAFVLDLFNKFTQETIFYNVFNIIGSGLLIYYAYVLKSIPFLVLEIVWMSFATYKLITILQKKYKSKRIINRSGIV
ncbi:MAG: hypothetical protein KAS12_02165 [Candidatus Aenigmarchaeota archaeon]|nr:hypothetical protein [Candidatus Aenigmarchaeota archaeon]